MHRFIYDCPVGVLPILTRTSRSSALVIDADADAVLKIHPDNRVIVPLIPKGEVRVDTLEALVEAWGGLEPGEEPHVILVRREAQRGLVCFGTLPVESGVSPVEAFDFE